MEKEQAKQRIVKLRKLIEKYCYSYHILDKSEVSDEVNDSLKHELQELEDQYPELVTPDSPTQRVGGKPLDKFQKVMHQYPMLSLTDAFGPDELGEWETRNKKIVNQNFDYFSELKIDGLAVSLLYENGIFTRGATRGDGRVGEDVTNNLKTIEAIPLRIENRESKIEIRGEVYLPIEAFKKLNIKYQKQGKSLLANPRNAAAGSIRQLDPKIAAERKLDFIAWDLITSDHTGYGLKAVRTHRTSHKILSELGFKTVGQNRECKNLDEVEGFKIEMGKERDKLPYQIDGIVVLINDNKTREKLGVVGKAPRGMIAYKFVPEEATTEVLDIQVQVGRTGVLTPVAFLKPVLVAGSTVSRATLHNEDEIRKKDIRVGDTVIIHKAGDVIPEVEKVIKELRPEDAREFYFPETCPKCGGKVVREEGKAAYRCVNKKCFTIQWRSLGHFVSRSAFDMSGLGPKILQKFIEEGLIKDAADLFKLKVGDIQPLERFAEKSAQNVVDSIQSHKQITLARFIYALGIPNVGEETAIDLAEKFCDLGTLQQASLEEIDRIRDIGSVVAKSIYDWFKNKDNKNFVKDLLDAGVDIEKEKIHTGRLVGKTFVFTGGLETLSRDEAKKNVREDGGEISESVSKETDYVVAGTHPGEKYTRAKDRGVIILSEKEFLDLIK
ncbi:MAG: ligase, NAD-dependent [Candidatus Berkelbacteria bacterium]|nr:ligase, NAD-dependent [Candidatus Berkelbacteria bacterium]